MPKAIIRSTQFLLLLAFLGFSSPFDSFSQRPIDSLKQVLEETEGINRVDVLTTLAGFRKDADPAEATELVDLALRLSGSLQYERGMVKSWLILATIASRQSDFLRTDSLIGLSMDLAIQIDDQHGLTSSLLARGVLNIRRGKYDEAIQNHIDGVKAAQRIGDGDLMQTHTMNIGHIKSRLNLPEEADKYFLESLKIAQDYGLTLRTGQVYLALGVSAYQRGDLDDCIANYEKALPVFLAEEEHRSAGIVLNNLGFAHYIKKDFEKADDFYNRSLAFRTQLNDLLGVSRIWLNKARIKLDELDLNGAELLTNRALSIARDIDDPKREMEVLEFLTTIYERQSKAAKALTTFRKLTQLKDSIARMANQERVAELTAEFELDKKENELNIARQEVTLLGQKEQLLQTRQFLLVSLVLLLLLSIGMVWVFQRARVKRALINEKLAEQRARNEALTKQQLGNELKLKNEELKSHAERLVQQNQMIQNFSHQLQEQSKRRENLIDSDRIEDIISYLERNSEQYLTWQQFRLRFDENYPNFTSGLIKTFPGLTSNELDISILLKINLANKEIAHILNISYDAVKKSIQRMYRKMELTSPEELRIHILKV